MTQPKERRLLLFNLRTDADDHILGFTTQWINALAPHYDAIDVLTTHIGRIAVADNVRVYSVGRERGHNRLRRLWRFYAILLRLLVSHRYVACFAHMQPLFASLSAPLLTLARVPLTTWYTHRSITRQLRWAVRGSWRIVTAVPSSFPLATPKVRPLGHGIDVEIQYTAQPYDAPPRPRIVQVARLTAIKRQHVLLEACQPLDCDVILIGDVPDGFDSAYKETLHEQVTALGMQDRVIFMGAQTPAAIRDAYRCALLAVNLSPVGLFDKAALEAMACGVPTLVGNPAFDAVLGAHGAALRVPDVDDVTAVRAAIRHALTWHTQQRSAIGADLRQQVRAQHSLSTLIQRLISVLETGELPDA